MNEYMHSSSDIMGKIRSTLSELGINQSQYDFLSVYSKDSRPHEENPEIQGAVNGFLRKLMGSRFRR